ncbi:MAG: hypothetical protein RR383_07900 [Muribaculaceae bacterium]
MWNLYNKDYFINFHRAFYHSGVTDIHIPNNIKQIGEQAFYFADKSHNYTTIKKSGVNDVESNNDKVKIYAASGIIHFNGDIDGKDIMIYNVYGNLRYSAVASSTISLDLPSHAIYIVRCGLQK